eukprot:1142759-Pelagomonas_calceolata.AAC.11
MRCAQFFPCCADSEFMYWQLKQITVSSDMILRIRQAREIRCYQQHHMVGGASRWRLNELTSQATAPLSSPLPNGTEVEVASASVSYNSSDAL